MRTMREPVEAGRDVDAPWAGLLSVEDVGVIARAGYGRSRGFGRRPALILIDCQFNHLGRDAPILDQLDEYPSGSGERAWAAVRRITTLRATARHAGVPVIYTRFGHTGPGGRYDAFAMKRGNAERFVFGSPGTAIVPALAPDPDELVIDKSASSALCGTSLLTYLVRLAADTVVLCGVSTSGCVRATCVDAVSHGFNVAVVADCVADRISLSHNATLLDIWMKYGDVVSSETATGYLRDCAAQGGRHV